MFCPDYPETDWCAILRSQNVLNKTVMVETPLRSILIVRVSALSTIKPPAFASSDSLQYNLCCSRLSVVGLKSVLSQSVHAVPDTSTAKSSSLCSFMDGKAEMTFCTPSFLLSSFPTLPSF